MLKGLRDTKWTALAAILLLLGQPAFAQKVRPPAEAALDDSADLRADHSPPPRTPRPQPEPRPAIWLLQDADTKIYLFGTVHILPPGFRWRSPAVNEVIRQSDELVMEISDREMMEGPQPLLSQRMLLGKTVPLASRVSPERREALQRMLDELGLPAEGISQMHSWAAALLIMAMAAMQGMAGGEDEPVDPEQMLGVEDGLETEFRALNRPIGGVETVDEQIGFFSNLSFAQQRELLEALIDEYASASGDLSESTDIDQWVSGDVEAIAISESDLPPMLYDVLIPRRNRAWTDWLIARLERPGTVLFAVGAGHLAGRDSVQTMLASRGFTVTRLH